MKKIIVVYATNSTGTEEACEIVRDALAAAGHDVALKRASSAKPEELGKYDLAILASGTWGRTENHEWFDGQLQDEWYNLAQHLRQKRFPNQRFAVLGLGDHRYTKFAAAADRLEELVRSMGGIQTGPTLRVDGYFFNLASTRQQVSEWAEILREELSRV